ncbi:MAG: hypothetical protein Q9Q40_13445, partial [Acidobacteriota bacterium]|nr:hypothetical protein [Acidobacteriota bacterium]
SAAATDDVAGPGAAEAPARRVGGEAPASSATIAAGAPPRQREPVRTDAGELPSGVMVLLVATQVEAGDLLVLDPDQAGKLARARFAADPAVVGVAAGPSREGASGPEAPVLAGGFARLKVDAGYGAIRPGDLLVSSPTPGHAMRALEIAPGTVIGKAIDALEAGTGTIRVALMLR